MKTIYYHTERAGDGGLDVLQEKQYLACAWAADDSGLPEFPTCVPIVRIVDCSELPPLIPELDEYPFVMVVDEDGEITDVIPRERITYANVKEALK